MCVRLHNGTLICNYFKKIIKEGERGRRKGKKETKEEKGKREKRTAIGSKK